MGTLAGEITRIKAAKVALETAIESKEVSIPDGALIDTYAGAVEQIEVGGGVDVSGSTVTADKMLEGVKAVNADGELITGTIPSQAAKTYTPGTSNQTIAAGKYLSGKQTIKGDANLKAENIKAGVSIFNVAGSFEGASSGGESFAKVTEFIAPYDAYSAITKIQVSGLTTAYDDNYGEDVDISKYNGTYTVTPATAHETDMLKRVYKHSSEKMYIFHGEEMEYGDGACWFFARDTGYPSAYSALMYKSGTTLPNGTSSWNKMYADDVTVTLNQVTTNFPAQPLVLNAVSATYNNGAWSYGSAVTLTEYDLAPAVDGIYLYNGTKLIGDVVDLPFEKWMPTDGLLMYFPLTETGNTVYDRVSKIRLTKVGTVIQDGTKQDNAEDSGGFAGTQNAFALPKNFTLSVKVNYTGYGTDGDKCVVDFGRGYSGFGIRADLSSDTVKFGLRIGNDSPRQINNIPRDEEHTITFTFEGDTDSDYKDCHAYVDGEERTNMTYEPGAFDQSVMLEILTRYFEETNVWASFPGTIRDVLLYNRILTDEEIATIANR